MRLKSASPSDTSASLKKGLWQDLSQNMRSKTIGPGTPGAQCTTAMWYSFEADAVLDGEDALHLQGFPDSVARDTSFGQNERKELAWGSSVYSMFGHNGIRLLL